MKKLSLFILIAAMMLSVITGCSANKTQAPVNPPAAENSNQQNNVEQPKFTVNKIAVTYVKSPLNVPSIIEKEKRIFEKAFAEYNLPIEYSNLTTGPEQTQALASGDIQFLYAVGATSVILSASNGADIKILNTYSRSPEAFRLFTNDETIQSAADLKGKKVAGPKGTILHELLIAYLGTAGLTESDIDFVSMGIPDAQAALVGGSVDCALLAGPVAYNMGKDGYKIVTTGEGLVDATIVVATSNDFYQKNPLLVERFLDAQDEILAYIDGNYDEMVEIVAKETELSADAVKEMYPMYDFNTAITDADIASMKSTVTFMKENTMIENDVNIDSLLLDVRK